MEVKRKKTTIDSVDRAILKQMYVTKRNLSGNQLAKSIKLSPSAIAPRLNNLKSLGIIMPTETKGLRRFKRTFPGKPKPVRITAPRSILWGLDIKKPRKRRK